MANEIAQAHEEAGTLYALVYRESDKYIFNVTTGLMEVVGTWDNARADECDIVMAPQGDMHFASFPPVIVTQELFKVEVRVQAGGVPDITDWIKSQGQINWDGILGEEINLGSLFSQGNVINQEVPAPEAPDPRARIYI